MCGIIGLLIKKPQQRASLGRLMKPMFQCMAARGPDSGGMAVFSEPHDEQQRRFNLFIPDHQFDWQAWLARFRNALAERSVADASIVGMTNHAILTASIEPATLKVWLAECNPSPHLLSVGRCIDVYKDMGDPCEIADRYQFDQIAGSHCVGHTRMATESQVTPVHAHPFTAGEDFCLVHNGSLSNPYMLRRSLEEQGLAFDTDNDTEAACRFIEWRLRQGNTLEHALGEGFRQLDGFYTLLMATPDRLTLVRDAFACKPAVVAETADYVAVGSEYRSLAHLPGVADADLFEPHPEEIYSWQV